MGFCDAELTRDGFLGGGLQVWQPRAGYRAAMDPVLLAAACGARAGQSVLELGCGAGVASLCLGSRVAGLRLTGLELQPDYADLARRNARENGVDLAVIEGDLAQMPEALRAQSFDHVIANPPYFPAGSGTAARDLGRETGQREAISLALWVQVAMRRLHPSGWLTMIQNADRLGDVLCAVQAAQGGSVVVLPIAPRAGRAAGRVIVRARKLGRAPLQLLAPLMLHSQAFHAQDGEDLSEAASAILRSGAELPLPR